MTPAEKALLDAAYRLIHVRSYDDVATMEFLEARKTLARERTTPEMRELMLCAHRAYYRALNGLRAAKDKLLAAHAFDEAVWNEFDAQAKKEVYQ